MTCRGESTLAEFTFTAFEESDMTRL